MDNTDASILGSDKDDENHQNQNQNKNTEVRKYRRYLPQVSQIQREINVSDFVSANGLNFQILAALANNLVSLNNGLFDAFPSIVIPSLIGLNEQLNPNETLRISASQASWIGKIEYWSRFKIQIFIGRFYFIPKLL